MAALTWLESISNICQAHLSASILGSLILSPHVYRMKQHTTHAEHATQFAAGKQNAPSKPVSDCVVHGLLRHVRKDGNRALEEWVCAVAGTRKGKLTEQADGGGVPV